MTQIVNADFANARHATAIVELLNGYAMDAMGGGQQLTNFVKSNLVATLGKRNDVHVVLAFAGDEPAGVAICIEGFSTFACQPLLNIHDLAVAEKFRGRGISKQLIAQVEQVALGLGCCKITLEVLEGNQRAQALYKSTGFAAYELDPAMGKAMLLQKKL
ncbi:acetyltransferase (GNAT) family protein [Collimonas sp. PA-H2]|uniref:GNAT family N-acetyltransferase n=1 Tax=Collimonas sp. PA-H2 TaxID=1881062 RepID=UPI000BFA97C3|nr:GNAT family N-acetyltransferase [Collimonas sp. PA-H2]PFH07948.1 acetyltransferase (GNAT) family protein [Collimonas sp. PA-H2]